MKDSQFKYSGTDNLEVMADAINYNEYLHNLISIHCKKAKTIGDFGAGLGIFADRIRASSTRVIAIEPDHQQNQIINSKGIECVADISQIPDNSLDAIYSINVLEHIESDSETLIVLNSKLKKNATLLIYVPAFQVLYSSMDRKVGHFRRYRKSDLNAKVMAANFHIQRSYYVDSLGFIASLAFKWIGDKNGDLNPKLIKLYDRVIFPMSRFLDIFLANFFGKNLVVIAEKK